MPPDTHRITISADFSTSESRSSRSTMVWMFGVAPGRTPRCGLDLLCLGRCGGIRWCHSIGQGGDRKPWRRGIWDSFGIPFWHRLYGNQFPTNLKWLEWIWQSRQNISKHHGSGISFGSSVSRLNLDPGGQTQGPWECRVGRSGKLWENKQSYTVGMGGNWNTGSNSYTV